MGGSGFATLWGVVFRYILIWVGGWYRDGQKGPATVMSKSPFKLKILYGELNEEVLASQAAVIQKAGHEVKTAVGRKGVEEAMGKASFDLVVLGQTLTRNDRHHLPYMVKKNHKEMRVLVMHTDGERHPYVDANIDTGSSMETLIAKISAAFAADAVAAGR